jgi:hypothetical protein
MRCTARAPTAKTARGCLWAPVPWSRWCGAATVRRIVPRHGARRSSRARPGCGDVLSVQTVLDALAQRSSENPKRQHVCREELGDPPSARRRNSATEVHCLPRVLYTRGGLWSGIVDRTWDRVELATGAIRPDAVPADAEPPGAFAAIVGDAAGHPLLLRMPPAGVRRCACSRPSSPTVCLTANCTATCCISPASRTPSRSAFARGVVRWSSPGLGRTEREFSERARDLLDLVRPALDDALRARGGLGLEAPLLDLAAAVEQHHGGALRRIGGQRVHARDAEAARPGRVRRGVAASLDELDFDARQRLLRLVLEKVRSTAGASRSTSRSRSKTTTTATSPPRRPRRRDRQATWASVPVVAPKGRLLSAAGSRLAPAPRL